MTALVKFNGSEVLARAETLAEEMYPEVNDVALPAGQRNALWRHATFVVLGKMGKNVSHYLREVAAEMFTTNAWQELRIPFDNDPTQTIHFEKFRDWLTYAIEKEAELSDTLTSTLNSFIENVVKPVDAGLVNRENGIPFTVDDVLALKEGHMQSVASAARQALLKDENNYDAIGEMLEMASDPKTSREDLIEWLRQSGQSQRRVPVAECNVVHLDDRSLYIITIESDAQEASINAGLNNRVAYRTRTLDDVEKFIEGLNENVSVVSSNQSTAISNLSMDAVSDNESTEDKASVLPRASGASFGSWLTNFAKENE